MKTLAIVGAIGVAVLGLAANGLAYDGGTKAVAAFAHPEMGKAVGAPIFVVPSDELTPSKPIVRLLHRVPQPTLSVERIRVEKPGRSTGTKAVVLFQRG